MKLFDLSGYNNPTKTFWCILLLFSSLCFIVAGFGLLSFSPAQFLFLALTILVAIISSNLQFRVSSVNADLWLRETLIFISAIWLGPSGAVFVDLFISSGLNYSLTKDVKKTIPAVLSSVIASFTSTYLFYFVLQTVSETKPSDLIDSTSGILYLVIGLPLVCSLHYGIYALLHAVFVAFRDESPILTVWKEKFSGGIPTYVVGLFLAFGIHLVLLYFGLSVGFLFIPIVLLGNLVNWFYTNKLSIKSEETSEAGRIHLATVEALATAIDARDQVGEGHARRVQIYAVGLGKVLGLSEDEIQALRTGALLHDIGKLAVPDHILNKPGRLTPAEMEKTKIHASVGAAILEKVNFPYPVVPTVLHHHERWDGTGYPKGLSKEDIPLTARIIMVSDAYDTLRGARPYRPALSAEEARRYLMNGAGTQFDPTLVDYFLRNWHHFEKQIEAEGLSYSFESTNKDENETVSETVTPNNQGYLEQIKRANREVYTLYELARIFSGSLNLKDTLKLFVEKVRELVPFDTCVIYLYNEADSCAIATYAEGLNAELIERKRVNVGEGATGYVLKNRQAVHNINPVLDFSFSYSEIAEKFTAMASLPLIANERLIGAISLYSCEMESYEDEYMRLLETISRIAADAISKSVTHAETETRALTDPMTNLPNARSLQLHFETEVARSKRTGNHLQVIMLDLDGFKAVNDTFGHKIGDRVLFEVGKVMKAQLRDYDFLARYAGDEFVAIVPEMTAEDVREICGRIEKSVKSFYLPVNDDFARVGVSIGYASYPDNGESLDQLIVAADQAMYSVKASHKQKEKEQVAKIEEERVRHERQKQLQDLENSIQILPEYIPEIEAEIISELNPEVLPDSLKISDDFVVFELDETHIISNSVN